MRYTALLTGIVLTGVLVAGVGAKDSEVALSKNYPSTATGAPEQVVYDAASAMQWLRTLSGSDWVSEKKPAAERQRETAKGAGYGSEALPSGGASIKTIAAGSTVVETYLEGSPAEMTIMYHMDGPNTLLANHYCAARNVPQWRFVKSDKPGEIKFEFDGGTNLNPKVDSHAHSQVFQVIDKDTYSRSGSVMANGKETRGGAPTILHRAPLKSKS
jgi:hypothetical protein